MAFSKQDALYTAADVLKALGDALADDKISKEELIDIAIRLVPLVVARFSD